jgi:hypothetical protein
MCNATDMGSLVCQTVLVCPSCPSPLKTAWILVLDIAEMNVCEFTTVDVCSADHFVVLPVRCRECREQELARITSGEITSEQWLIDVPWEEFYLLCSNILETLCGELSKLYVIPQSYDRRTGQYRVPIYAYSALEVVPAEKEDGVYAISNNIYRSSRRALDEFFGY